MISFNHLGNLGRLGNQMFQYAALKGIASKHQYNFCIPPKKVFGSFDPMVNCDLNIYDIFGLHEKNNLGMNPQPPIQEKSHNFDENLFNNCPDNVDLIGYFQTEKYFKHIENEIRQDFIFDNNVKTKCLEVIKNLDKEIISLHIRRGDYVHNPNHPVQPIEYYKKALEHFPSECYVIIFSDDPKWCDSQELFSDSNKFLISHDNSVDVDLCMMSLCNYHIIANSSYSWWGAWLAKSKKVVAPRDWFGGNCSNKNTDDMSFGNWVWLC